MLPLLAALWDTFKGAHSQLTFTMDIVQYITTVSVASVPVDSTQPTTTVLI